MIDRSIGTILKCVHEKIRKTKYDAFNRRNLTFNLTEKDIISKLEKQNYKCALTGKDLEFTSGGSWDGRNPNNCSIDRIDNNKGYEKENIQLVCCIANLIKNKMDNDDFIDLCISVADTARNKK